MRHLQETEKVIKFIHSQNQKTKQHCFYIEMYKASVSFTIELILKLKRSRLVCFVNTYHIIVECENRYFFVKSDQNVERSPSNVDIYLSMDFSKTIIER